mmetsp:Transcript_61357/g.171322  ORF Transcript_61357/g.171322 Transcript_61357/m.171322 type:complete len:421 (-) Transcript_61357:724-1986(-)
MPSVCAWDRVSRNSIRGQCRPAPLVPQSHLPFGEEVVAFVVHDNESREILDLDAPHRLHAELLVLDHLHLLDRVLREVGRRTADAAQIEAAVLLAGIRDALGPVALGQGDHGVAPLLEHWHVRVHAARGGGAEAAARVPLRRLGRARVVDHVGRHVVGQGPLRLEALGQLRVRDVARHDDGARQRQPGLDRELREDAADVFHGLVEVDAHRLRGGGGPSRGLADQEASRVLLQLLDEDAVVGDLGQHLPVRTAGDANAHGTGGAVTRHADHPDVVDEIFATELRPDAEAVAHREDFLLPLGVAVRAPVVVAGGGQVVEVARGRELHGLQAQLGRQAAYDDGEMVRRASGGAKGHDLLRYEFLQLLRVQQRLRLLIEVGLVGRAATLRHEHELVLVALHGIQVELGGQVALRVLLCEHGDG